MIYKKDPQKDPIKDPIKDPQKDPIKDADVWARSAPNKDCPI